MWWGWVAAAAPHSSSRLLGARRGERRVQAPARPRHPVPVRSDSPQHHRVAPAAMSSPEVEREAFCRSVSDAMCLQGPKMDPWPATRKLMGKGTEWDTAAPTTAGTRAVHGSKCCRNPRGLWLGPWQQGARPHCRAGREHTDASPLALGRNALSGGAWAARQMREGPVADVSMPCPCAANRLFGICSPSRRCDRRRGTEG